MTVKTTKKNVTDHIIFIGIAFLLVFAPLSFGAVHVWAYTFIQLGVFSLLCVFFIDRLIFSRTRQLAWVKTPINLFFILFVVLILFQTLPLPAFVVKLISPHTYTDKIMIAEIINRANNPVELSTSWMNLAYYLHPVLTEGLKLAAYAGMFFLVLNTVCSTRKINFLIYLLIALSLFESLYAIFQVFSEDPRVWWWESRFGILGRGSGTFIGANHFAGYLEMTIPLAFGFMLTQIKRSKRLISGMGGVRAFYHRMIGWFDPESASPKVMLLFFCTIILVLGLLYSGSRGGIVSACVSISVMGALFWVKKRKHPRYWILPLILAGLAIIYGLNMGMDTTIERFKNPEGLTGRIAVTKTIGSMIGDYPAAGVGWGNFRHLYPRYIKDYDRVRSSGHAHNDWAEAGAETGVTGLCLIFLGFGAYIINMFQLWKKRRDTYALGIGAGVMAGMVSLSIHSFFDFNMHIPANPLTLAAIMALGYAAVHKRGHGYNTQFFYKIQTAELTRRKKGIIAGCLFIVFGFSMYISTRHLIAEIFCPTEWNSTLNLNWQPKISDIQKAVLINPMNAEYYFKEASYYTPYMDQNERVRHIYGDLTEKQLRKAIQLNPANGSYWLDLGNIYSLKKEDAYTYLKKWIPLADNCFNMAVYFSPKDVNILFGAARYWVWRSNIHSKLNDQGLSTPEDSLNRKKMIDRFQSHFKTAIKLTLLKLNRKALSRKQFLQKIYNTVDYLWDYYPDEHIIMGILPEKNDELKSLVLRYVFNKYNS